MKKQLKKTAADVAELLEKVMTKERDSSLYWATPSSKYKDWPDSESFTPRFAVHNDCGEGCRLIISNGEEELIRVKLLTSIWNAIAVDLPMIQSFVEKLEIEKGIACAN